MSRWEVVWAGGRRRREARAGGLAWGVRVFGWGCESGGHREGVWLEERGPG